MNVQFQQYKVLIEYDQNTDSFKSVVTTIQKGSEPKITEEWVKKENMISKETIEYLSTNCEKENGVIETVSVHAGEFKTCKLISGNTTVYLSNVPFGIVRTVGYMNFELISYEFGTK